MKNVKVRQNTIEKIQFSVVVKNGHKTFSYHGVVTKDMKCEVTLDSYRILRHHQRIDIALNGTVRIFWFKQVTSSQF